MSLPTSVQQLLDRAAPGAVAPAWLRFDLDGQLCAWGGGVEYFGLAGLDQSDATNEVADFLHGLIPPGETPLELPFVEMPSGRSADVHVVPNAQESWVVLIDSSAEQETRQQVLQKINERALRQRRGH